MPDEVFVGHLLHRRLVCLGGSSGLLRRKGKVHESHRRGNLQRSLLRSALAQHNP